VGSPATKEMDEPEPGLFNNFPASGELSKKLALPSANLFPFTNFPMSEYIDIDAAYSFHSLISPSEYMNKQLQFTGVSIHHFPMSGEHPSP